MNEVDYNQTLDGVVAYLRGHADLTLNGAAGQLLAASVTVADDLLDPTADACPHVQVVFPAERSDFTPTQLGQMAPGAFQDLVKHQLHLICTTCDAESPGNAARQRNELARLVVHCLRQNPTLDGKVTYLQRRAVRWETGRTDGGIFSVATVVVEVAQWV